MDLATLTIIEGANQGALMPIIHPNTLEVLLDNEGNEMWIKLAGEDSTVYRETTRKTLNRRLAHAQERGRASLTQEELEAEALTRLVKCTLAWHLIIDSKTPECTEKEVRRVYQNFPWLYDQVTRFVHERHHFLASSNGNSSTTLASNSR